MEPGSVNHSAQFYTWKERKEYSADDTKAGPRTVRLRERPGHGQPADLEQRLPDGNSYHAPDHSKFSGMNIIDMRMHMNFGDAYNASATARTPTTASNDATYKRRLRRQHDVLRPQQEQRTLHRRHRRLGREHV
ncbi:hypothetical protein GCM10023238_32400 [Streptomyces heliomycini]